MRTLVGLMLVMALFFPIMGSISSSGLILFVCSLLMVFMVSLKFGSWFSAILFLVYISGILVLFSYMLATSNNPNRSYSGVGSWVPAILVISSLVESAKLEGVVSSEWKYSIIEVFEKESSLLYAMVVVFLFLCLLAVVTLCMKPGNPLRGYLWAFLLGF